MKLYVRAGLRQVGRKVNFAPALLSALALASCAKTAADPRAAAPALGGLERGEVKAEAWGAGPSGGRLMRGRLLQEIDAPPFSYLQLKTASGDVWVAVARTAALPLGEEVGVMDPSPRQNHRSESLGIRFGWIFFGTLMPPETALPGPPGSAPPELVALYRAAERGPDVPHGAIARVGGGVCTVEALWSHRRALAGQRVVVRGRVVKSSSAIGRLFLHLRDGSGSAARGDDDLTVITREAAALGEVITAQGKVVAERDFGAGYVYPVVLDEARLTR